MRRCVIVSAGEIRDYQRIRVFLKAEGYEDSFFIFCDGGLAHAGELGIKPDVIVGDFDSCAPDDFAFWKGKCEMVSLPREKDDTDTFYAVKLALAHGFDDFVLLGAMGARFDHAFANVSVLMYLHEKGKAAAIIDDYSVMRFAGRDPIYIEDSCSYFSVLAVAGSVRGVTIKNAKYPLENAELSSNFQLGGSNEVLPGHRAEVSVEEGAVLVVEIQRELIPRGTSCPSLREAHP